MPDSGPRGRSFPVGFAGRAANEEWRKASEELLGTVTTTRAELWDEAVERLQRSVHQFWHEPITVQKRL